MVFQTQRITSSAGDNLIYPRKHGMSSASVNVDIKVGGVEDRGWIRGWWLVPDSSYRVGEIINIKYLTHSLRDLLSCISMVSPTAELTITDLASIDYSSVDHLYK